MIAGIGELLIKPHVDACAVLASIIDNAGALELELAYGIFLSHCQKKNSFTWIVPFVNDGTQIWLAKVDGIAALIFKPKPISEIVKIFACLIWCMHIVKVEMKLYFWHISSRNTGMNCAWPSTAKIFFVSIFFLSSLFPKEKMNRNVHHKKIVSPSLSLCGGVI